jgi:hypothetical protein
MSQFYDVLLDPDTGDLPEFTRHVRGLEMIAQRVRIRLATFLTEWFLDETQGIDWIGWTEEKPFRKDQLAAALTAEILQTQGVTSVSDVEASYSGTAQSFGYSCNVRTAQGELSASVQPFGGGGGNTTPFVAVAAKA